MTTKVKNNTEFLERIQKPVAWQYLASNTNKWTFCTEEFANGCSQFDIPMRELHISIPVENEEVIRLQEENARLRKVLEPIAMIEVEELGLYHKSTESILSGRVRDVRNILASLDTEVE